MENSKTDKPHDEQKKSILKEQEFENFRMYHELQYNRIDQIEARRENFSNLIITISLGAFTIGFGEIIEKDLIKGILLPLMIIIVNVAGFIFVNKSRYFIKLHQQRAKNARETYAPTLNEINRKVGKINSNEDWLRRDRIYKYLHIVLVIIAFLSVLRYNSNWGSEENNNEEEVTSVSIEQNNRDKLISFSEQMKQLKQNISEDSILSNDNQFINDQILKDKFEVKLAEYIKDDCLPQILDKKIVLDNFEGFQNIGDIDNDKKDDFVFVLHPLNFCEEGQSYYFSNPNIPRIKTTSYCCHPESIFSIGDIDEDGSNEIGQYFSSCASKFKSINIFTLKNNQWNKLGRFTFTLNDKYEQFKDFHKLSKKTAKGEFQFLEISDTDANGKLISKWKTIKMK